MAKSDAPKRVEIADELTLCPACDYTGGFHVSFVRDGDRLKIVLVCPSCSAKFDIDWTA